MVFGIPFPQIGVVILSDYWERRLEKPCLSLHKLVYVATNREFDLVRLVTDPSLE